MLLEIDNLFWDTINKDYRKFKSFCYDEDYNMFSKFNTDKMETLFLFSMTDNNKCMRDIKKKCMDNGITEKYMNNLFYTILKYKYKTDNGIWSWNEIEEYDIPLEMIKKTSTKFKFI
tara:strand:+ start:283 stop:633 length:351 start_codon:yes stop_codon:yes gene_type:complete